MRMVELPPVSPARDLVEGQVYHLFPVVDLPPGLRLRPTDVHHFQFAVESNGRMILPGVAIPVGTRVTGRALWFRDERADWIFELGLTPNRTDYVWRSISLPSNVVALPKN